jgi:hypothetical protein
MVFGQTDSVFFGGYGSVGSMLIDSPPNFGDIRVGIRVMVSEPNCMDCIGAGSSDAVFESCRIADS